MEFCQTWFVCFPQHWVVFWRCGCLFEALNVFLIRFHMQHIQDKFLNISGILRGMLPYFTVLMQDFLQLYIYWSLELGFWESIYSFLSRIQTTWEGVRHQWRSYCRIPNTAVLNVAQSVTIGSANAFFWTSLPYPATGSVSHQRPSFPRQHLPTCPVA